MTKVLIGNVKGPKGDPGDEGPRGPAGPAGPNTVPTNQAVADAVAADGPARQELQRTFVALGRADTADSRAYLQALIDEQDRYPIPTIWRGGPALLVVSDLPMLCR